MAGKISLENQLADELRADLAERYFGFRRLIEEDTADLAEKVRHYSFILQKRVSFDLIRIYILLRDEEIIHEFLHLITLERELFYDRYLVESPTIVARVFAQQHFHGLTSFRRFRNFILDCYENLVAHSDLYRRKFRELQEKEGMIVDEIRQFYRENDLSAIMHFLHRLGDREECGCLQGGIETGMAEGLAEKLRIQPPHPIERTLPFIPPLPALAEIKNPLVGLIQRAWPIQPENMAAIFNFRETPPERRQPQDG